MNRLFCSLKQLRNKLIYLLNQFINTTADKIIERMIKDVPIITGVYVQPATIPVDVDQLVAPIGLDIPIAISCPLDKPINTAKLPLKNKNIIRIAEVLNLVPMYTPLN